MAYAYCVHPGNDGQLVVWNLLTGERIQDIDCAFNGQISCSVWVDTKETFVFGCADGSIHLYKWSEVKVNGQLFSLLLYS